MMSFDLLFTRGFSLSFSTDDTQARIKSMTLYVGTSGTVTRVEEASTGKIPAKDVPGYYSATEHGWIKHLYRMPQPACSKTRSAGAGPFRFSLKASQRITHFKRLKRRTKRRSIFWTRRLGSRGGRHCISTTAT